MKILLFEAVWCKDCKLMHTMWRNIELEMPDLEIQRRDIDEFKDLSMHIGVFEVPTAIFYDDDEVELIRITGLRHRDVILDLINKNKNL